MPAPRGGSRSRSTRVLPVATPMEMHRLSASRSIRRRLAERSLTGTPPAGAYGAAFVATPAGAHGFGQRYELPLPLELYLFGGAAGVAPSFFVSQLFVARAPPGR